MSARLRKPLLCSGSISLRSNAPFVGYAKYNIAFITEAHEAGLVPALDEVVITQTLHRCAAWPGPPRLYFINASAALLTTHNRLAALIRAPCVTVVAASINR